MPSPRASTRWAGPGPCPRAPARWGTLRPKVSAPKVSHLDAEGEIESVVPDTRP
ncbi:hypothetical protein I79_014754 [Cricetulus griseus]|uniref:Uncharacterized protein n=1 Tax=Cricetulus griseus TaxID=10029 RepID=G3HUY3_CRIGR|nr:hypothetical protein I79_014754 [Cricetulus griseus]